VLVVSTVHVEAKHNEDVIGDRLASVLKLKKHRIIILQEVIADIMSWIILKC
jgi:hypothetical protein